MTTIPRKENPLEEKIRSWIRNYQYMKGMSGKGLVPNPASSWPTPFALGYFALVIVITNLTNNPIAVYVLLGLAAVLAIAYFVHLHLDIRDPTKYRTKWFESEVYRKEIELKIRRQADEVLTNYPQLTEEEQNLIGILITFENKEVYKHIFVGVTKQAMESERLSSLELFRELASDLKVE